MSTKSEAIQTTSEFFNRIDLKQPFGSVLLELLDVDYNAFAVYEATWAAGEQLVTRPRLGASKYYRDVGFRQFKAISVRQCVRPS